MMVTRPMVRQGRPTIVKIGVVDGLVAPSFHSFSGLLLCMAILDSDLPQSHAASYCHSDAPYILLQKRLCGMFVYGCLLSMTVEHGCGYGYGPRVWAMGDGSGQRAVKSGQWAVGSGQWAVADNN